MQIATFVVQLVLLLAYGIGVCVVINTLKTQNRSQSDLMDKMKQYADLLRVEEFRKYVEMTNENIRMEQEKIRAKELEEQRKAVEQEFKTRANEGITLLLRELRALSNLSSQLVAESPENTRIDGYLSDMNNDSISKQGLIELRERVKANWRSAWSNWLNKDPNYSPSMLAAVLLRMQPTGQPEKDTK